MPNQDYHWKRFWCPQSDNIRLNGGYLPDPGSAWGRTCNPKLVSFEDIADLPCLVLLGEAGMGKTTALEAAHRQIFECMQDSEDVCLPLFRLGDYGSDTELCNAIFRNEVFHAWHQGTHKLHLFFDSLDEGLLSIKILVRILKRELENLPCDRLYLRITCRTADWAPSLENKLKEKWGEDSVIVYELAPLRQIDVIEAADKNNINPDDFSREVFNKNATPLASKPITLKFLVDIYSRKGQLPSSQVELYEQGCLQLCEEVNPDRCEAGFKGKLSAKERRLLAGRVATAILFPCRSAIWTSPEYGAMPDSDLSLQTLCIGKENADERDFDVNEDCIRETFSITGLFSAQGMSYRVGFAHRTYAEFLAAWYLNQSQLNLDQILNLIIHPDQRVVPQLRETAAWLASMMPGVFWEIVKTDPDVLLQSDIAVATDIDKAVLVKSLLQSYDEERLLCSNRFWQYQHLNYPQLPDDLQEYIVDSKKHESSRLTAIDIARACNIKAVQTDLADIALDSSQPYLIRVRAADTLGEIGDEENKAELKPLVIGEHEDDPEDDLKGYALQAMFPQHLPIEELLNNITQPKSHGLVGGVYPDFLARDLAERLQVQDIPVTLRWLAEKFPRRYDLGYPFQDLSDSVMLKAWENCDQPAVLNAFANIAITRLKNHDGLLGSQPRRTYTRDSFNDTRDDDIEPLLKDSDVKRRQLIETIVSLILESENDYLWLVQITAAEDIPWMMQNAVLARSDKETNIWVKLTSLAINVHNLYSWKEAKYADAILSAYFASPTIRAALLAFWYKWYCKIQNDQPLRSETLDLWFISLVYHLMSKGAIKAAIEAEFEFHITPIELGSQRAKQISSTYLQSQVQPREPEPLLDLPPKQRVLEALEKVESGQPELWWQICLEMTLTSTSTHYNNHSALKLDLTTLLGWLAADTDSKARIVKTAKEYLEVGDPETQTWLGTNKFSNPPFAGYQALYLLSKQDSNFIEAISAEIWMKWIPVILHFANSSFGNKGEEDENCRRIIRAAYQNAPDEFIMTLIIVMNSNNYRPRTFRSHDVYRLISNLVDDPLPEVIINKVGIDDLQAGMLDILLADFFDKQIDKARSLAVSLVSPSVITDEKARAKAVIAARMLVLHPDDASWLTVWSVVQQDHEFGREVLESVALQAARQGQIEQQIKEEYLADLYIFLAQEYPDVEDCKPETRELRGVEAQVISETDEIRMWKNYLPQRLQERATWQACEALRKIIRELPAMKDKLQWRLLEAEALTRRQTWQPPKPEEVLHLILDQDKRLVQNGEQLLDVLVESLDRLEIELQGETSAVRDLWDKDKGKNNLFRPIDENDFSNYLKRFLDRDLKSRGIIVNREVELRRSYGGNPGERTDIHVDAVLKHPNGKVYDLITVIIEVKGCWHEELDHAMESQLVKRYLSDNTCHHGLYLVGWFNCDQWDQGDNRRKNAPKLSIDEARAMFAAQAEQLSQSSLTVKSFVLNTALR